MLNISEIYLFKQTLSDGIFTIKFITDEQANGKIYDLSINNIKLDMTNSVEPITYFTANGKQLISGSFFDIIKRRLMKLFNDQIHNSKIGVYKWDSISNEVRKE